MVTVSALHSIQALMYMHERIIFMSYAEVFYASCYTVKGHLAYP